MLKLLNSDDIILPSPVGGPRTSLNRLAEPDGLPGSVRVCTAETPLVLKSPHSLQSLLQQLPAFPQTSFRTEFPLLLPHGQDVASCRTLQAREYAALPGLRMEYLLYLLHSLLQVLLRLLQLQVKPF